MSFFLILTIVIALVFAFINGFHDGGNVFATAVASRSISPRKALILAFISEFTFPLISGTAVAMTIGKGIITYDALSSLDPVKAISVILAAMLGAIIWNILTWVLGLPSSSSHALIGGLIGSGACALGIGAIEWSVLVNKVLLVLLTTPFIGFLAGYIFLHITSLLLRNKSTKVNGTIKRLNGLSILFLAGSHGAADSQKTMGLIALLLMVSGHMSTFEVPFWLKISSSGCLALGVFLGGWKIIHTVGSKIFKLQPRHSLDAQLASASVILTSSLLGGAVSTSQIVSSTIMGIGAGERYNAVRWQVVENIVLSWLMTIPAAAILSAIFYFLIHIIV